MKNSEQDGKPVRFACHKVELAKASAKFGQILRNQELMVFSKELNISDIWNDAQLNKIKACMLF